MNRTRRPPLQHPLACLFDRAVDSLTASLNPDTTRHYRGTARNFLSYLGADHPEVNSLSLLRRQPHILGWMSRLRSQAPPLATASYINLLITLRCIFNELAWTHQLSELAHLIRREDIPRLPKKTSTSAHSRAGSTPAAGVPPAQRSGCECLSADSPHRHAHRRMRRSGMRLPSLHRPGSVGNPCAAGET